MLVVGLLFILNNYTMGFYIQPEYSIDQLTEQQCDELADKINDMLSQDKIQEAKDVLKQDGIELTLDDLKLLKEALFNIPSIDTNVCEAEFDWEAEPEDDSEHDTIL